MPTTIDSLVVTLGLDPSKFNEGQRSALESFKKSQEEFKRRGKDIEDTTKRINESVSFMRTQLLGAFALFAGGKGIKEFTQYIVSTTAEAGRFAERMENSTEAISKWVNAARLAGAPAAEMTSFMRGLSVQFTQFKQTGTGELPAIFRGIGVSVFDANNKLKPFDTLLTEMNEKLSKMSKPDALGWVLKMGGTDAISTFLSKAPTEIGALLNRAVELGPVFKADADAAREIETALAASAIAAEALGRAMMTEVAPAFVTVANLITEAIVAYRNFRGYVDPLMKLLNPFGLGIQLLKSGSREFQLGESVPHPGSVTSVGAPTAGGLPLKPGVSTAGASIGLMALAASLQSDVPGLNRITSMTDSHKSGKHTEGLALDFTIQDGQRSAEVAAQIRARLASMGVGGYVKDEYKEDSKGKTGPHIHVQFNSAEDARRYAVTSSGLRGGGGAGGSVSKSSEVNINTLNVVTQATDAEGIARELPGAIQRNSLVTQGQTGPE